MIENQKLYLSVSCGTISGYHDKLILPNIVLKSNSHNNGYGSGIGFGWWKWRAYINLFLNRKPKKPVFDDKF